MDSHPECLFCKIVSRAVPAQIVYSDEWVTAFRDIHPAAPTHVLIVPNRHVAGLNDLAADETDLGGQLLRAAARVARQEGVHESGYRVIINTGADSGQIVFHLHLHLIGGQHMRYPIG
jgi:histidine triad (HIT) family protein